MTTTQQQGLKVPSEALSSDGLTRFIGWGAWAAIASGLAMVVSLLMEWLIVPHERLGSRSVPDELLQRILWAAPAQHRPVAVGAHRHLWAPVEGRRNLWAVGFRGGLPRHGAHRGQHLGRSVRLADACAGCPELDVRDDNGCLPVSGGWSERVLPALRHRADPVRGGDVHGGRLSALGIGIVDHFDTRDHLPRSHAGIVPGVYRPDLARHRGGGPRLVRPEDTDFDQVASRTEDRPLPQGAETIHPQTKAKGKGTL